MVIWASWFFAIFFSFFLSFFLFDWLFAICRTGSLSLTVVTYFRCDKRPCGGARLVWIKFSSCRDSRQMVTTCRMVDRVLSTAYPPPRWAAILMSRLRSHLSLCERGNRFSIVLMKAFFVVLLINVLWRLHCLDSSTCVQLTWCFLGRLPLSSSHSRWLPFSFPNWWITVKSDASC